MIVLADTSLWVDLWRHGNTRFAQLLAQNRVVVHPFVLSELALGRLTPRAEVLKHLAALDKPRIADHHEVLALIDGHRCGAAASAGWTLTSLPPPSSIGCASGPSIGVWHSSRGI